MSTFFWILGLLAVGSLTFLICYFLIDDRLGSEWVTKQKQLEEERQNFKKSYADAQQWYSRALKGADEKTKELQLKEKALEELKQQLEAQITKNNQEKEKCIFNFRKHYEQNEAYVIRLEAQLANARQRTKRLAKQAKNQV